MIIPDRLFTPDVIALLVSTAETFAKEPLPWGVTVKEWSRRQSGNAKLIAALRKYAKDRGLELPIK